MSDWAIGRSTADREAAVSTSGVRGAVNIVLVVLASVAALVGGLALYARSEIVDASAFSDHAVQAVQQPVLQRVIAREITVQAIEPSLPDVIAARPVLQSALQVVIGSALFRPIIRLAAEHGHRLLFERGGGNAAFDIADAGTVVSSALQSLAPKLARSIPRRADAVLLSVRRRNFADTTLRLADHVRVLGIVLPLAALALFALIILTARDRRAAVARSATAVAITGVAFMVAFELARRYVISHTYGANELTTADVRGAVGELWDVYLGDLMPWALGITVGALLVAAAARSVLAPYSPVANLKRVLALARRGGSNRARGVRGALILAFGIFAILRPTLAFEVLAVVGGCVLVYVGVGELLTATAPARPPVRPARRAPRRRAVTVVALGTVLIGGIAAGFLLTGETAKVRASSIATCNGYPQLCARRLDEVVFAGTHNSMSAADSRGWLIANQDRTIHQQLQDGIRLFKISTHYAVEDSAGGVHTDIAASGPLLNRVASKLSRAARLALQRLSRALSGGSFEGRKRDIWLCHTLCELGATRMVDFLATIRSFLERNPDQVIILFDEDYAAEPDLQSAFQRAGLFRYLDTLQSGQPLPTLEALIRSRHNVLVFAQKETSGKYPWDMNGFQWIQDTPLGAQKPAQFTCRLYRGQPSNPLLMMNNWADTFPPRLTPNLPLVKRAFILARARQCIAQRGRIPNLILTDYYNRGNVVGAAAELNGVAGQRPAPIVPWS